MIPESATGAVKPYREPSISYDHKVIILLERACLHYRIGRNWCKFARPECVKAASHDSEMLVTSTKNQQMTEAISSTSSFDQLNWRRRMLHFCRRKPSAQVSQDTVKLEGTLLPSAKQRVVSSLNLCFIQHAALHS